MHIRGQPRQAGGVSREVNERNRMAISLRHFCAGRQVLGYWISQRDLSALDHVSQQQSREHLRFRANFEDCLPVERVGVTFLQVPISNHAPVGRTHDAYDYSDAPVLNVDSIDKYLPNVSV
jgi:hypothetical protein